jgi:hypothetical protein
MLEAIEIMFSPGIWGRSWNVCDSPCETRIKEVLCSSWVAFTTLGVEGKIDLNSDLVDFIDQSVEVFGMGGEVRFRKTTKIVQSFSTKSI